MMTRYAEGTKVSTEKSRSEIEKILTRYGATAFAYGWENGRAVIQFEARNRCIRFVLPLPDRADFAKSSRGARTHEAATAAWEQACRQSWRALALVIKAKLEAVAARIVTFEDEFLAQTVLPDGKTVSAHINPQIALAYREGAVPKLIPDYTKP